MSAETKKDADGEKIVLTAQNENDGQLIQGIYALLNVHKISHV